MHAYIYIYNIISVRLRIYCKGNGVTSAYECLDPADLDIGSNHDYAQHSCTQLFRNRRS